MPHRIHKGFTLIELLIVVAIIAILAAIAVINFLEAQTRAKVARVRADVMAVTTGLEAYAVDYNHYPPDWNSGIYGSITPAGEWKTYRHLTTPVAYLTTAPENPFRHHLPGGLDFYDYYGEDANPHFDTTGNWTRRGVRWVVFSYGPDGATQQVGSYNDVIGNTYDATNGTISAGDIGRSNLGILGES